MHHGVSLVHKCGLWLMVFTATAAEVRGESGLLLQWSHQRKRFSMETISEGINTH